MAQRGRPKRVAGLEAAIVARHFYLGGKQKSEIAEELGMSRFRVARLLDDAQQAGMVHISIDVPAETDLDLGDEVAAAWSIHRCIPVRSTGTDEDATAIVGAAAAGVLETMLTSADVLGISWGRALTEVVGAMDSRSGADVVQLVGGVRSSRAGIAGAELVRRLAGVTGGRPYPLNAPYIVRDATLATELRREDSLRDTVAMFERLTVAAVGIGSWEPPNSALIAEIPASERAELVRDGAAADICGMILDAAGQELDVAVSNRVVGVTSRELRRVPTVVAIASGPDKVRAIAAALRSGVVDALVTDVSSAQRLLRLASAL